MLDVRDTCSCVDEIEATGKSGMRCCVKGVGSLGKVFQDVNVTGQNNGVRRKTCGSAIRVS